MCRELHRGRHQGSDGAVAIVTWNVNSLNARLPRVLEFVQMHAPDVALLQETKTEQDAFPSTRTEEARWIEATVGDLRVASIYVTTAAPWSSSTRGQAAAARTAARMACTSSVFST
jgi:exonuclease III